MAASLLGIAQADGARAGAAAARRPNILWLVADNIGPDLGCYGAPLVQTPRLDGLAADGIRYDAAFSTAPICAPSRSAFITGMHAVTIDAQHMRSHRHDHFHLPEGVRPIMQRLILRWPRSFPPPPGYRPGRLSTQLVSLLDLTATTLAFAGIDKPAGMQSRVFLGSHADPPRRYVFTHRDRHDEVVQRIRSVRSDRYRYIRNDIPQRPFLFYHAHKEAMYPAISLLRRLGEEGRLTPVQEQLLAPRMADEELYDLQADPYEVHNLAASGDPEHRRVPVELRGVLADWINEVDDQGQRLEPPELVQRWIRVMYDRWGGPPPGLRPPYVYSPPYWPPRADAR